MALTEFTNHCSASSLAPLDVRGCCCCCCDIAGVTTCHEAHPCKLGSNAYLPSYTLQGELMEGDNAWMCEALGRRVSAIRRACFKTLPTTLLIHLKRFEYDHIANQRCVRVVCACARASISNWMHA